MAGFIADQILRYLFGEPVECSVFVRGGIFEHKAGWLLGIDRWEDVFGEVVTASGRLWHMNESFTRWQEWEDVVGEGPSGDQRSSYQASRVGSFPFLTSLEESRWLSADNPEDGRLYLRTKAAPRNSIKVDWSIAQRPLLPVGVERDHYEVEIVTGTPLTKIGRVSWATDDPRDLRLRVWSEAESPFRWFKAEWRVYSKQSRQREVVAEISDEVLSETTPEG